MKRHVGIPLFLIALAMLASAVLLLGGATRGTAGANGTHSGSAMGGSAIGAQAMGMSYAAMANMAKGYWATHARRGPSVTAAGTARTTSAVTETVTVVSYQFDADHDPGTQVDTVRVHIGDTVMWLWGNGTHTVTSGTGDTDPNAGIVFDQPIDGFDYQYQFTSATPETIPYYCAFHGSIFNMKGVLEFTDPLVGVDGGAGGASLGFAGRPWPNPSRDAVNFRYALLRAGHVHAEVLDVRGRELAAPLDAERAAGTYEAAWNGRLAGGALAPAGRYFLRLTVPGAVQSRGITLMR